MSRNVRVSDGYATYSDHGGAAKCGQCPVRERNGLCPIRAEVVAAMRPCCRYGHKKMLSAQVLRSNAKRQNKRKENQPMKWLVKLICPSADTLAGYAADGIAKSVNSSKEEVKAKVAKYATYAESVTQIANTLAAMAKDGSLDKTETAERQRMLTPLFAKVLALV